MSVQRSPTTKPGENMNINSGNSTSQPDLSTIGATDNIYKNVSQRKRKVPEDDYSYQFNEFKKEMMGLLKEFGKTQTENINSIKTDIKSINEQLIDMKTKTDLLLAEHKNFKSEIQTLTNAVTENQEKIKCIENDVQALQQTTLAHLPSERSTPIPNNLTYIMTEVQERLERAKNIIIAGIPEPHSEKMEDRRENDRCEVMKVMSDIYPPTPQPERLIRLGKYDAKKTRPLKVCFSTPDIAKTLLKNKSNCKTNNIKLYFDQTPNQKQEIANLREELRQRKEKGENDLIIKYIKGTPKIIKQETKNGTPEKMQ